MKKLNLLITLSSILFLIGCTTMDQNIMNSKNFKNGKFVNSSPTNTYEPGKFWEMSYKWLFGGDKDREPVKSLPIKKLSKSDFSKDASQNLRFIWIGHSSILLEIEGKRYLFDPVFSQRASFVQWAGPKRFHPLPIKVNELPRLDGVIISHNHYDHLDKDTIQKLSGRDLDFYVPLGIGKYLKEWGIEESKIFEFDWWDNKEKNGIQIISTPARHFSGRGLFDSDETLWCSWVLKGKKHRVYFSGDTGFTPDFKKIGSKFGAFNLTFIKIGAYDKLWPDIHLNPEAAIQAHKELKGNILVPIHWGAFNLALHSWHAPPERLVENASKSKVKFIIPGIGEIIEPVKYKNTFWWRDIK